MRKTLLTLVIFILTLVMLPISVEAACTTSQLNNLKKEAYKVEFDYSIEEEENEYRFYLFSVLGVNTSEKFYITNHEGENFFWRDEHETSPATLGMYYNGERIKFEIYSSSKTSCPDTLLHSESINLPFFNDYSLREECAGKQSLNVCKKWYDNSNIKTEEEFQSIIANYKEPIAEEPIQEEASFQDFIIKNRIWFIGAGVVLLLVILALVLKTYRKKKMKISIKGLKAFLIIALLLSFGIDNVKATSGSGSAFEGGKGNPHTSLNGKSAAGWYHSADFGVRLSLYRYDGKNLVSYGSVDVPSYDNRNYNALTAGGYGKLDYTMLGKKVTFSSSPKSFRLNAVSGMTPPFIKNNQNAVVENGIREKIINKFNLRQSPAQIARAVNAFFPGAGNRLYGDEIYDLYITVEPLLQVQIVADAVPGKYGTIYELNQIYYNTMKVSAGIKSPSRTWWGNLIYAKLNQEKNDIHNFVGNKGSFLIRNVESDKENNGDEINSDPRSGYAIGVFWLAGEIKTCNSSCAGKTGDALLTCAESYCASNAASEGKSKGRCITDCGYRIESLNCPSNVNVNGSSTTCEADTQSSRAACSVIKANHNGASYQYLQDCNTTSKAFFPDLSASVSPGEGYDYDVVLSGSKSCILTFDYLRWKYDYAAAETNDARQAQLDALKGFNNLNWSALKYDSKNASLTYTVDEVLANRTSKRTLTLIPNETYQFGSDKVYSSTKASQAVYSYHNGNRVNATVNVKETTSNNAVVHKLPEVCLSYKDSGIVLDANKGSCANLGTGPYNKIYSNFNAKENATNLTVSAVVDGNASGLNTSNTCSYVTKDVSCVLVPKTSPDKDGYFSRGTPISFELVIDGDRSLVSDYGVDGATKLSSGLYDFTWPNLATPMNQLKVNGWIKTNGGVISCPYQVNLKDDCPACVCRLTPLVKSGDTYSVGIVTTDHNASSKYYIGFNKGLDVNNANTRKYYERSSVTFDVADGITSIYGYVVENGRIHKGPECILTIPSKTTGNTCRTTCLAKDYDCIESYCEKNPSDGGLYSSYGQCVSACSTANTCKQKYTCGQTEEIKSYCAANYASEGYVSIASCINDCGCYSKDYFYRTIDIANPFPDRKEGLNWFGLVQYITEDEDDKTSTGAAGGDKAEYVVELSRERILAIRGQTSSYNKKTNNNAYLDYVRKASYNQAEYKSKFIHDKDVSNGGFSSYFTVIDGKEK